ncbi:DUF1573 domain-containing protein [Candidatus Laterigemmans baculatus]|uniref:DUF1573 domain-containing protein n=1 Tax=Candidatus Laterigemmans baculatus TaxID=2770505 RepID=UPI0013DA0269|nr:DUF1573 domain-containing protein [Candidatus Laterigemmans baculatus]
MLKSIFRTALFSCLTLSFSAAASAADWAQAMFPVKTHNFGSVAVAAKTEFKFPIQNRTNQDIHIADVRASCGCTTPIVEQQWIRAGEEGVIRARFNTDTFRGQKGATLTVVIDRPAYAEVQLRVDGYIRRDIVFHPGAVEFGKLAAGEAAERTVAIAYAGRGDWQITGVESPSPYLLTELREKSRSGGRVDYELVIKLTGEASPGYLQEELVLTTNDRKSPRVPLQVIGQLEAPLSVAPQTFAVGTMKPGDVREQRLVVRGKQPFKVTKIECKGFEVEFEPTAEAKPVHILSIRLTATEASGAINHPLLVHTDGGEAMVAQATVTGEVVGAPASESKVAVTDR